MNHKITEEELVKRIGGSGIQDVTRQILDALGIQGKLGVENPGELLKLAPTVVAYTATMAAFKELKKAQADLSVAQEERKKIEAACQESIQMIRQYRQEMDNIVSRDLTVRLETFENGFRTMDQAILDSDADGYIRGSVEIQKILGYDTQFTNQQEFDELMISDEAFKL